MRWHASTFHRMSRHRISRRLAHDAAVEREELIAGLQATPATIAPKHFYDELGCALYAAICALPEYYPTRTERAIFDRHRDAIAACAGRGRQFVDLGSGDGAKALAWLPVLEVDRYFAVDFAAEAIAKSLAAMAIEFPGIEMQGIVVDFTRNLDLGEDLGQRPTTFFYPGSSIGNFAPDEARRFLRDIHRHCEGCDGSGLLIGVDTKKDVARLTAAYDDPIGVTAAFNRNVLRHVNRILGSDFRPEAFAHRCLYDERAGRVEMHLEACRSQRVALPGTARDFAAGERIHTENSYKYTPEEFAALLRDAGYASLRCWQDEKGDFAVFYAA
ncbi:MAG: L-histidine N(alpha)-methyltransferase [Burkholderiales bacterium]|nr:L-histidine N(alpha)-methyltransferase [Burkholderiales bacterium]